MSWTAAVAIYFIFWWITLFAILPFGVRTQDEDESVEPGTVPSAPSRPLILRKFLATTVVSAVFFGAFLWLRKAGVTLDSIPFLPRF